jgi:hypothetical protein
MRNEMSKLRIKHLFAVRAIMTPEQRQKARELMKAKMGERKQSGEGRGAPGAGHANRQSNPPPPPPVPAPAPAEQHEKGGE